jgi:hypothetical protein
MSTKSKVFSPGNPPTYPKYSFLRSLKMKEWGFKFDLPERVAEKAGTFPESSYGATILTLVLKDGTRVPHVHVAGGRNVIKASGPAEESLLSKLDPSDIVDVLPET